MSDDGDSIRLEVDDVNCKNQFHFNINGAVNGPTINNCVTTLNSKSNLLEGTLNLKSL